MASTKKEDDLVASISKTMTVDKLKENLTLANVGFSSARKKADFVDLYISNGLHKGAESLKEESLEKEEGLVAGLVAGLEEEKEEKEEVIMSITIMGHGCEDLLEPWAADLPISTYFKNNVRVYSKSCVPDVNSIGNIFQNEGIIQDVQQRFSRVPTNETSAIISTYADEVKDEYMKQIASTKIDLTGVQLEKFKKITNPENIARASSLSTYLSNKTFMFYNETPNEKISNPVYHHLYKTLGLQVTDIRLKTTTMDGSVRYRQIFSPKTEGRVDLSNYNLIYKNGLTYVLKDVLKMKHLVKPALEIFGFKGKNDRITSLTLEQIYDFFQLIGVKYANLMDYTCRSCSIGPIPQGLSDKIYSVEQSYRIKPVAFGKQSESKLRKSKKHSKHIYRKNKYSRKI